MDETPPRDHSGSGPVSHRPVAADPRTGAGASRETAAPGTSPPSGAPGNGGASGRIGARGDLTPGLLTTIAALLTIGTAAIDVVSFTRLGSVFASVMTSNIVFLGMAAANQSAMLAEHAAVSFAGYVAGVAAASRMARVGRRDTPGTQTWSAGIAGALAAETGVFVIFTIGWAVTGTRPAGGAQLLLLAVATVAMGMQSAVVVAMGIAGVSTTYMTGTLTMLIEALANPDRYKRPSGRQVIVLLALVAGAGLSGLMLATVPSAVLVIPFAVLFGVMGIGTGLLHPRRGPV
ncbi:MAG TPA: YoaK family protein [Streptosporangiaceae bacterium]|jgi:uncharacterized membrane protein YoaK (UPF0700 family)